MKNEVLFAALALILCVATDSFSFGRLENIQQKLIVHVSSSGTAVPVPAPVVTPQKRSTTRYLSSSSSKRKSKKKSGSSITSFTISGKGSGKRPTGPQRFTREEDVEDLIDRLAGIEEKQNILVTAIGQKPYEAEAMLSGVDNDIRVDTDGGRVYIPISEIDSVVFGTREFNQLALTVKLRNGNTVKGTIYQKYILEFYANGALIPTYANQLSSVKISSAGSR